MNSLRKIYASSIAAITAIVLATTLTIVGELSVSFKNWLKSISGHHWETKSIFTIVAYVIVFAIVYASVHSPEPSRTGSAVRRLIAVAIACTIIVTGFFIWHYFTAV